MRHSFATGNSMPATDPLPLFPLQSVLFPDGLLPLKVFEARYLDLVTRCMRGGESFGVLCLRQGREVGSSAEGVLFEEVGVVARIDDVESEQTGILRVRCTGQQRFRLRGAPMQQADGLWEAHVTMLPGDSAHIPAPSMLATVQALGNAITSLREQGTLPFVEPFKLDDAGWVANRWCELLPITLAAKQKLMELDDPVVRLSIVDGYLREKKVVK
jgi:uncharacterized protein